MNLRLRKTVGFLSRRVSFGTGLNSEACLRCGMAYQFTSYHGTVLKDGSAVFIALCESCFSELNPNERLPFYRKIFDIGIKYKAAPGNWEECKLAVLSGN